MAPLAAFAVLLLVGSVYAQYGDQQFPPAGGPAPPPGGQFQGGPPPQPPFGGGGPNVAETRVCTFQEYVTQLGYSPDPEDCGGFWRCDHSSSDGEFMARRFQCPAGQQYHPGLRVCGYYPEHCNQRRILS